jgi:flagellar basal body-associated protein FliL
MFEQELEMEEREASVIPLLLIVALVLAIVGVTGYFLWQNHQVLTPQEATRVISGIEAQRAAVIHFHVGRVTASVDVKPHDPNYVCWGKRAC